MAGDIPTEGSLITSVPLTYGQLAIWRDVESLPEDRWHEPNLAQTWALPAGTGLGAVREALAALARRHESLRTTYDLTDPAAPEQVPHLPAAPEVHVERTADPRADLGAVGEEAARQMFSLVREPPWRAVVVAAGGTPTHLVLAHHHIVADGVAMAILRRDFFAALTGTLGDAVTGPRTILEHERSPAGRRRAAAALDYWAKLLAEVPPRAAGEPPFVEARLVSRSLARSARRVAARLRVSLANVVLAAYCAGLFALTEDDRLAVRVLSSNRFDPYRLDVVTSMNQWIPVLVDRASRTDPAALIRELVRRTRVAYAHGVYDVDRVFRMLAEAGCRREQYDSTWSFNFISRPPEQPAGPDGAAGPDGVAGAGPEGGADGEDEPVEWAAPFSSVGPRYYLRVIEGAALTFEVRVPARQSRIAAELIRRIREFLLATGRTG